LLGFAAPETVRETLEFFERRFGIPPERFAGHRFLETGAAIWMLTGSPHVEALAALRLETAGIALLRRKKRGLKPTTAGLRLVGSWASRNIVEIAAADVPRFLARETITGPFDADGGFVIVRSGEDVLGCGIVSARGLESQIPDSLANGIRADGPEDHARRQAP
jgi:NOL1/NOP2/fmu family ribosome biogenesis protein